MDFLGQGGSYLQDATGSRIKILPDWTPGYPAWAIAPDAMAALAALPDADVYLALPALGVQDLTRLDALERAGQGRGVVLRWIADAQVRLGYLGPTAPILQNPTLISANWTVPPDWSAVSAGPIRIAPGVLVKISQNAIWRIM